MTYKPTRLVCRVLAACAWLTALAFFGVALAASWGYLQGAMLMWSMIALPLAVVTRRWLAAAGAPIDARLARRAMRAWQVLGVGFVVSYGAMLMPWSEAVGERLVWWLYFPLAVPYGVFPLVLTGWALWRAVHPEAVSSGAAAV